MERYGDRPVRLEVDAWSYTGFTEH